MSSRKWFTFVVLLVAVLCVAVTSGHRNCTAYNSTTTLCSSTNGTSACHGGGGHQRRGRRWIGGLLVLAENEKRLKLNHHDADEDDE
ncbi:hypothetical protein pipiens_007766 [Culex pipiens pipiens]|uniref:Uncharacterized protein n=1 Tax=Culex pipiens pipiens TaxID=38569 RepID=A0ABD1DK71_CULPP